MDIEIRPLNKPLDAITQDRAKRRLQFALGRFGTRIRRVLVRLEDLNGPRGGVDQRCLLEVNVVGHPPLRVEVRDAQPGPAIARAAGRAARRVRDTLTAQRTVRRRKRRPLRVPPRQAPESDAA